MVRYGSLPPAGGEPLLFEGDAKITMKKLFLLLTLLLLTLVACGGAAPEAPVAPAVDVNSAELSLPDTVDVATVAQIKDREDVYLIDVREQFEYDEVRIPGVTLIPLAEVQGRMSEIPTDKTVIVTCRSGNRSGQAVDILRQAGFDNVHNMEGGIVAWQQAGYDVER